MSNDFPEILEDEAERLYVRRGCNHGFTVEECRDINTMRFATMKYAEHITAEDALAFARAVLTKYSTRHA